MGSDRLVTVMAAELLTRARKLHQEGALDEAAKLYREALELQPKDSDSLRELGLICLTRGRPEEALRFLEGALQIRPNDFDALLAKANTLATMKRYPEALVCFEEALNIKPESAEAHNNRGGALGALGRHAEALASFDKALHFKPDYADAHRNRGNALRALGRRQEAFKSFERLSVLRPDDPSALLSQAAELRALKRPQEALACVDRALAIRRNFFEAHVRRGELLVHLRRYKDALASFDAALALKPRSAQLHAKRGGVLRKLGRFELALASFESALAIEPRFDPALIGRAQALMELRRPEEALESYNKALATATDPVGILISLGHALFHTNRHQEAIACFRHALHFQPDSMAARMNLGLTLMREGKLPSGLREFEWRWKKSDRPDPLRHFPQARWMGQVPVAGKTLFLYCEQGLGDTLQMVRYVPMLAKQGARVIVQVQTPLVPFLQEQLGAARVIGPKDPIPPFDLHSPLMSLLPACGTTLETIRAETPYLAAPRERIAAWSQRLKKNRTPRVGIAWSGNPMHGDDRNRSIALKGLLPLLSAGVEIVSLQKDVREGDREVLKAHPQILDFASELKDFADTAALVSLLDLVISVDTAPVHLAGALGKQVWVLLPFAPDWRWLLDREDSPWYPTARLFRQPSLGDWESVIQRAVRELQTHLTPGRLNVRKKARSRRDRTRARA